MKNSADHLEVQESVWEFSSSLELHNCTSPGVKNSICGAQVLISLLQVLHMLIPPKLQSAILPRLPQHQTKTKDEREPILQSAMALSTATACTHIHLHAILARNLMASNVGLFVGAHALEDRRLSRYTKS
jgi:uncharacterized membrane protein